MDTDKKQLGQGTYGSFTELYGHDEPQKWSFTDDLYKELKDSILK